jgi:hypothetical protein
MSAGHVANMSPTFPTKAATAALPPSCHLRHHHRSAAPVLLNMLLLPLMPRRCQTVARAAKPATAGLLPTCRLTTAAMLLPHCCCHCCHAADALLLPPPRCCQCAVPSRCHTAATTAQLPLLPPVIGHGLILLLSITKWRISLNSQSPVYVGDELTLLDLLNLLPEGTDSNPEV